MLKFKDGVQDGSQLGLSDSKKTWYKAFHFWLFIDVKRPNKTND